MLTAELPKLSLRVDELPLHPWLPIGLVDSSFANIAPGSVVALYGLGDKPLGMASWNPTSHARLRLLGRQVETIDTNWFRRRLEQALERRKDFAANHDAFRWIFAEADGLPGLVVDRYGDAVSVQVRTLTMDHLKPYWLEALTELGIDLIVERSDFIARKSEGLEDFVGILRGDGAPIRVVQQGALRFEVDLLNGPKTGFYLDQRLTSEWLQSHVTPGEKVADLFCSVGQLAIASASAGAEVTAVDNDPLLEDAIRRNANLNNVKVDFVAGNAFEWLEAQTDRSWDQIIMDPPAIAKHRGQRRALLGAIYKLVRSACRKLGPSSRLTICSCSHQLSLRDFVEVCTEAGRDAGRRQKSVHSWGQPDDHFVPIDFPESRYLSVVQFALE